MKVNLRDNVSECCGQAQKIGCRLTQNVEDEYAVEMNNEEE